mgnify:FL=1
MPEPQKGKGESTEDYRSRLIRHYTKKGRDPKQAQAIGYSITGTSRKAKRGKRQARRNRRASR